MRAGQQIETESIRLLDVLKHEMFAAGYISVAKGLAFDPDHGADSAETWFYERGRAVAVSLANIKGRVPPLWVETASGSSINPDVVSAAARDML